MAIVVDTWDSGQQGDTWDSGLQFDVNIGPNTGDISSWLSLVTSEHRDRPKFIAFLSMLLQPIADIQAVVRTIPSLFDLDVAVGAQLDIVGLWVGVTRNLTVALPNIYFSFGVAGLGFGEAIWRTSNDPLTGLVILTDDAFRTLIRARIANNQWDGTIPGAYTVWELAFTGTGIGVLIQDYGNMHMLFALTGPTLDAVTEALLKNGYLNLKPAGVLIVAYVTPTVPNVPYFGFGVQNPSISGFGTGAWGKFTKPS
jgi:hypothetical protein